MSQADLAPLEELCCGDPLAIQFCDVLCRWVHWIDDILDKDQDYKSDHVIRLNLEAVVVFSNNEFFQKNKELLCPLILQAARAFGDSLEWSKRKSEEDRRAADVMKGSYHEVFWHVAYLTAAQQGKDGWQHMSAMTKKYRAFDFDFKPTV